MSPGQHGQRWNLARIHSQLQGNSARASHFFDAETCEFPSLSMLPVSTTARVTLRYLTLTFMN